MHIALKNYSAIIARVAHDRKININGSGKLALRYRIECQDKRAERRAGGIRKQTAKRRQGFRDRTVNLRKEDLRKSAEQLGALGGKAVLGAHGAQRGIVAIAECGKYAPSRLRRIRLARHRLLDNVETRQREHRAGGYLRKALRSKPNDLKQLCPAYLSDTLKPRLEHLLI